MNTLSAFCLQYFCFFLKFEQLISAVVTQLVGNGCYSGFSKEKPLSCHIFPFFVPEKYLPALF